jgi:Sphingosine kinase and enzymes related to eukaryotic diacylglycerol kinase
MLILVNPYAGGGTALKKWSALDNSLLNFSDYRREYILEHPSMYASVIQSAYEYGERDFVAAGGDGTVNLVLNNLVRLCAQNPRADLRLGAIGLGSSNDFHKPLCKNQISNGFPYKLDFHQAQQRDIGCVQFNQNGKSVKRYFLSNASIGVTAEANYSFNNPDLTLKFLKRVHTPSAILYAVLKTIFIYKNISMTFGQLEKCEFTADITNLAVLKNPNISGNFCYQTFIPLDDGIFTIHLCHNMPTIDLLKLLWALSHGKFQSIDKRRSWSVSGFTVRAPIPFAIEFDGEVIKSMTAEFSVLPRFLKVCP